MVEPVIRTLNEQCLHRYRLGLSERRSLAVVRMSANSLRYEPRPDHNVELRAHILAFAQRQQRYDVGMIHLKIRQVGRPVSCKRVEWLYQKSKLRAGRRKRKKVLVDERQPLPGPERANGVWSMDFVYDRTGEGRVIMCLTIVDDATHESVAIKVERAIPSHGVSRVLERLELSPGLPMVIRTDDANEFCGKAMVAWWNGRMKRTLPCG
jgi:putative transposase